MDKEEWISVSEYASRIGKSAQTVYNRVRAGKIESTSFKRGQYNGILVKYTGDE